MTPSWTVRPATLADAAGIAVVHVEAWREAYAGIVPQAVLDALSIDQRRELWTRLLGPPATPADAAAPRTSTWVAEDSTEDAGGAAGARTIVGIARSGPARDADAAGLGELQMIYVRKAWWDRRVGHALHEPVVAALRAEAFPAAILWVLDANPRARRFYERHGWRTDGTVKREPVRGAELDHVRYRIDLTATPARGAGSMT